MDYVYLSYPKLTQVMGSSSSTTPKEYVKTKYPDAIEVYRFEWDADQSRFVKHYSVCLSNASMNINGQPPSIGRGMTAETAWLNAMFNLNVRPKNNP
jgi:hypothetical protein